MVRSSQYRALHHFTFKLHEAIQRAGFQSRLLENQEQYSILHTDPSDLIVGFNGVPRTNQKELLCDDLKIPYLSLLVDPPYRFFYLVQSPWTIIGCDDQFGCTLLQSLDFTRSIFLPHAVEPELSPLKDEEYLFEVVMLATFIDYEERRNQWKSKFPPSICKVMDDAIELTFSDPTVPFIAALDLALIEDQKKHPTVPFEGVFLTEVLEELEIYIKGRDRINLLKAVPDCTVHLFGHTVDELDWKKYLGTKHPNIAVHSSVSYAQALEIMKKSKILLNPSIKNKAGAHERVFTGLATGAQVVTYDSSYLRETFKDKQGLIFYSPSNLDSLNEQITFYLANEKERHQEVERGRKIVEKHHTWDHRVKEMLSQAAPFLKSMKSS